VIPTPRTPMCLRKEGRNRKDCGNEICLKDKYSNDINLTNEEKEELLVNQIAVTKEAIVSRTSLILLQMTTPRIVLNGNWL
jgi:hypothetical protein